MNRPASVSQRTLDAVDLWAGYYRANPHRFVEDVLNIKLRLFQKIVLVMMNINVVFVFIAVRGIGKTFLSAIYCVVRAILYPGSKIIITSKTRGQGVLILEKIVNELKPRSPALALEISEIKTNGTNQSITFENTSFIKVVTAGESARGNRGNILIVDEFRLVPKQTVDDILSKMLTNPRMPDYEDLSEEERRDAYNKELLQTLFLSSAYFQNSWAYQKCIDTYNAMLMDGQRQFVCGLPYQLAIREGLLRKETVEDQMLDSDFSDIRFSMEMCALWYGSAEGAFFDFDTVDKARRIQYPMLPEKMAAKLNHNAAIKIVPKKAGEKRILSADIALMASGRHQNDATAIFMNQLMPTKAGRYTSNIVYADSYEGLRTEAQALIIRKLFDEFMCDYLVLDSQGIGLGVYDCLAKDIYDPETGEVYPALSCCNNPEMAARAPIGAPKVIWAIKASAQFNSDTAFMLREAFRSGRIRLLLETQSGEDAMSLLKGFDSLDDQTQLELELPYYHTALLIDELIKLQFEENGGKVKMFERAGMRKDRYSSLSYNYYVASQLESKLRRRPEDGGSTERSFIIRPPKSYKEGGRFL